MLTYFRIAFIEYAKYICHTYMLYSYTYPIIIIIES